MDKSVLVYEGDKGVHLMVKCDYRLEVLENRVALTENGLQRVEEGLNIDGVLK